MANTTARIIAAAATGDGMTITRSSKKIKVQSWYSLIRLWINKFSYYKWTCNYYIYIWIENFVEILQENHILDWFYLPLRELYPPVVVIGLSLVPVAGGVVVVTSPHK